MCDIGVVIRVAGKKSSLANAGNVLARCPRSPIIRSRVNSRNSCHRRRRRRLCAAPLLSDKSRPRQIRRRRAARFIYAHARLAYKSSARRNIDRQRGPLDLLASFHPLVVAVRAIHVDVRYFSCAGKRGELVTKARKFIIARVATLPR